METTLTIGELALYSLGFLAAWFGLAAILGPVLGRFIRYGQGKD